MNKILELIKKIPEEELRKRLEKIGFVLPEYKLNLKKPSKHHKPCKFQYHDVETKHHYECITCGTHEDILYRVDYLTENNPPNELSLKIQFICVKCRQQQKVEDVSENIEE